MKYLLIVLILSMVTIAEAASDLPICQPPAVKKHRVRRKKKVLLAKPAPVCPSCPAAETVYSERIVVKEVSVAVSVYKNYLSLLGGVGPFNTDLTRRLDKAVFSMSYGPVVGVGYTRHFSERWMWELRLFSNATGGFGLGYGF